MRDLELGLWWCFDRHHCLVFEPWHTPEILVGDVSIAFVLIQQFKLQLGVPNQVVQLIFLSFEISLKSEDSLFESRLKMISNKFPQKQCGKKHCSLDWLVKKFLMAGSYFWIPKWFGV